MVVIEQTMTIPTPRNLSERLELANHLYREYRTRCFWHCPQDLNVTEDLIPFVVKGLRANGGRRGFILASKLLPDRQGRGDSRRRPRLP